ncbi:MAG: hypothetical protein ABW224_05850 [Kibdelosporangium sp.]
MSERELRDGLKLAVADEPPMKFDLDELMDTAERLARRRRALIAVGASTAAVAVAAVAVPVVLGISGGQPIPLPQAAPPTSVAANQHQTRSATQPPKKPAPTKAELQERGAQMQAHLKTRLPAVVPGAKEVGPGLFGGEAEGKIADGQEYLGSFVSFTLGTKTAIEVQVQASQGDLADQCKTADDCRTTLRSDGSTLQIDTVHGPAGNTPDMVIKSAIHLRTDGSAVRISTYNYDPSGDALPVYQPDVALTVDQITALATDPALYW